MWHSFECPAKMAAALMLDGIRFCWTPQTGVCFEGTDVYVGHLKARLAAEYGGGVMPGIAEVSEAELHMYEARY